MCGLAGWTATRAAPPEDALSAMAASLAHRTHAGETLCALVDRNGRREVVLAASLSDGCGISLALDGAILNAPELKAQLARRGYAFGEGGDAEILLRAYQHWDKDVVKQLRGAFAFAIWDARKDRLLLARDRFGEKPLYLHEAPGALVFASELKALLQVPGVKGEVDVAAVGDYLRLRYVPGPRTLLSGIRKLAPGSCAVWQFGHLKEMRYWTPPDGEPRSAPLPADPVAAFIERLAESVQLNMAGTAPVGALLSGGFDSTAIVALMKRRSERVATFAGGFSEDPKSELAAAAAVAKHLGTAHHEITLERRAVLERLPELVASRGAPLSRPADAALHLIAREVAKSVRVALSGDGGDEILGGYRRHTFLRGLPVGERKTPGLFVIPVQPPRPHDAPETPAGLREILYYEQTTSLPDNVLERTDRLTRAASLEVRTPFLDHRLAEYVATLPDALRVRGLSTKRILRAADRQLYDGAVRPQKRGFRIPVGDLLRGECRTLLDWLRGPGSQARSYCDGTVLDRVIDEHLSARKNREDLLWTLLNLEIWHRSLR